MAQARAFILGNLPADQKFRGQGELIINAMREGGQPLTVAQITAAIKDKLVTRQDGERVVAFYMSVWKKKGWVKLQLVETPDGPEAATDEAAINAEDAASTGATEEQRVEAATEADLEVLNEKTKVSDAVLHALRKSADDPLQPGEIVEYLQGHGYAVRAEQVNGALQNLVRRGAVTKGAEGFAVVPASV